MHNSHASNEYDALTYENPQAQDFLLVDWNLGNTCNYRCSYCPDHLHDGKYPWHDYKTSCITVRKVLHHYQKLEKKCIFQFTGGEVSLCPYLREILVYIKKYGGYTSIISNGSRTEEWWEKISPYLDNALITYHGEFAISQDFLQKISFISKRIDTLVSVTVDPKYFADRKETIEALKGLAKKNNFTVFAKPLLIDFGDTLYPYTTDQKEFIKTASYMRKNSQNLFPSRGMVQMKDGSIVSRPHVGDMIIQSQNYWFGWKCSIGINLLTIKFNGDIYRGQCGEGGKVGNIFYPIIRFPIREVICKQKKCTCLSDIMNPKYKVV